MMLWYFEDCWIIFDVDVLIYMDVDLEDIVCIIGGIYGWVKDWLNMVVVGFIFIGGENYWELIYDDDIVLVWVVILLCLFFMKLKVVCWG